MSQGLHWRLRSGAADLSAERVTLEQLALLHGPSLQGSLLVLLAAPCLLPVPGIGNVMGLALMGLAVTLWRGGDCGALPRQLAGVALPRRWARVLLLGLARFYELAGLWSRQRLSGLAVVRPRSWLSGQVGLMGALIFLPLPLGNVLPALALALVGLGIAVRDGCAVLLALLVTLAAMAYTLALGMGAWWWLIEPLAARF